MAYYDPWLQANQTRVSRESKEDAARERKNQERAHVRIREYATNFDIEVVGITENGSNALSLCLHVHLLDLSGLRRFLHHSRRGLIG